MSIREKLAKRALKAGLSLPEGVMDGLNAYFELLRKWNRKVSLTSLPVEEAGDEALDRLLIEPALATRYFPEANSIVLDVGSGGGSPAIPMKLAAPRISLRMVEAKTRKAAFLREVARTLELGDAVVDAVRFEELLARPALHDAFDVLTLRAVRVDRKTLSGLQSFIRPAGLLFLFGTASPIPQQLGAPHLTSAGSHVLLNQWGSRLELLRKVTS